MRFLNQATLCLLATAGLGQAHSWIEQLSNVAPDGSYTSSFGYPRGFVDKGITGYVQGSNTWVLPQHDAWISREDLLCHPFQRVPHQSLNWPRLKSVPGATVAMRYAENGHVTMPGGGKDKWGKPRLGGTVFVFGTSQPSTQELLLNVLQWTRDGQGGDKRGRLLSAQNFDDERCYQPGNGMVLSGERLAKTPNPHPGQPGTQTDLLCETDVQLPLDVPTEEPYTLYWIWQWPTAPGKDEGAPKGKDEYYTSCIDVDMVKHISSIQESATLMQQGSVASAVQGFSNRGAITTDPLALYSNPAFHSPFSTAVMVP